MTAQHRLSDPRPRRPRRLLAIPDAVAVMAALALVGAAGCLLGVLFPMHPDAPRELGAVLVVVGTAIAALDLGLGARLPRWALHVQLVLVTVAASALVARSQTGAGAMTTAIAFPWFGVYAALYFTRAQACAHAVLLTGGLAAGMTLSPAPLTAPAGLVVGVSLWTAVVALSAFTRRLKDLASTDPLTGLLNRAGLFAAARREMARAARNREPLTLLAIDLDELKAVNDEHGHLVGDRLLASAAEAWLGAVRGQDVLARIGGDEFVVLAPATTETQADALVARLRAAHPARWSAGARTWEPGEPFDAWLERADRALYGEKAQRRADHAAVGGSP